MANLNPLELKIVDVKIKKFNGNDEMSIMPQFTELSIYQSMFEPVIKAEMLLTDNIGLFVNYPFTGEEIVTIYYQHLSISNNDFNPNRIVPQQIQFIIKGVRDIIVGDRARTLTYVVELTSVEFLQNVRKYVSHAYDDLLEDAAEKVYQEYILDDTQKKFQKTKNFFKEPSVKVRQIIIPNLRPFQAIQWLAKHAVSADHENKFLYLFFENGDGFNFTTIQSLIETGQDNIQTLVQNQYKFVSDAEIARNDPNDPNQDLRVITNIVNNKRFSSIEKIAGGYYQNELFEISMLQKAYNSTNTELDSTSTGQYSLGHNPLNTPEYVSYVKNQIEGTEYSNRIRYIINNYEDFDTDSRAQPDYRLKFGQATKYLHALNQIDLSITVPANMDLNAGDIIYCLLPETHGFNIVQPDKYISGMFIISEVKHVLGTGNRAATTLRIYKDGYLNTIFEDSLYNTNAPSRGRKIINPTTGNPYTT
jgi:hypothetical protein